MVAIEDIDWEVVDALDTLVIHVLALTVPELKRLLDRLGFAVDKKPQKAPGDGPLEPRPWQIVGASGEEVDPDDPFPSHSELPTV